MGPSLHGHPHRESTKENGKGGRGVENGKPAVASYLQFLFFGPQQMADALFGRTHELQLALFFRFVYGSQRVEQTWGEPGSRGRWGGLGSCRAQTVLSTGIRTITSSLSPAATD